MLFVHAAIISAVVEALGLALNLFKHISEACSAFGTELALVKSVSEKLNVISLEVKPLHGQRLHTDAAVLAVKQLEKHLDTWKPQLTAYLKKPPTGWRPFAKGLSRLFFKQPKMQVIMQGIQRGIEDHRNALDKANVQPVITVDRDLPKPHIKPYALNMLEGLLRDVHSSTQPPKVVVLRGENGTGKSILSILVAQDLEAAGGWVGQCEGGGASMCALKGAQNLLDARTPSRAAQGRVACAQGVPVGLVPTCSQPLQSLSASLCELLSVHAAGR